MTDSYFFDTDCLSAFLWTNKQNLLTQLYPGKIVIPSPVYTELSRPSIQHLKGRLDNLIAQKLVLIKAIDINSQEYNTYYQLTERPQKGHKVIGNGEAASIALAKEYDGVVASNNLRDVQTYLSKFNLKHTTTSDILVDAYMRGLITEAEGNSIWSAMLSKRRKLGSSSFSDYLKLK